MYCTMHLSSSITRNKKTLHTSYLVMPAQKAHSTRQLIFLREKREFLLLFSASRPLFSSPASIHKCFTARAKGCSDETPPSMLKTENTFSRASSSCFLQPSAFTLFRDFIQFFLLTATVLHHRTARSFTRHFGPI